jgi:hypothetical protein
MSTDEGFLSRWSRRKALVREGLAVEPAAAPVVAPVAPPAAPLPAAPTPRAQLAQASSEPVADEAPPTLDDVARLPADANDFSRFVAPKVPAEVRNAAMKKLFSDPHFNIMDGLDVYIDDYGKPDPLPADMLRRMVQSQMLGLFAPDPADAAPAAAPTAATELPPAAVGGDCAALPSEDAAAIAGADPRVTAGEEAVACAPQIVQEPVAADRADAQRASG